MRDKGGVKVGEGTKCFHKDLTVLTLWRRFLRGGKRKKSENVSNWLLRLRLGIN